ncbi:MAG: hypothetical protein U1E46_12725 [Hyphomicrobiales bacterium]
MAILLAAVVTLPTADVLKNNSPPPIPVDIVSNTDVAKRQAVSKDAPEPPKDAKIAPPKVEKKSDPKPAQKVAEKATDAAKEAKAPDEPKLEELIKKTEDTPPVEQPPETKTADAPPPPTPKTKPKPPQKKEQKLNLDEVAALLNKTKDPQAAPTDTQETGVMKKATFNNQAGMDPEMAQTMMEALRARISQCWSIPAGIRDGDQLLIKLQINFNQDGSLASAPALLNSSNHPAFMAAVRAASAAIVGCAPYGDILPADKYTQWRSIIVNFDPSQMLGTN